MTYKYITENNLYEKQSYMYSEYTGMRFLEEYLVSRKNGMKNSDIGRTENFTSRYLEDNPTKRDLKMLCERLKSGERSEEVIAKLNQYVKSFEVRKRIYTGYDDKWRPTVDAGFENYENYMLFAECLITKYERGECLKYFSCLLKVDDTLLSVQNKMDTLQRERLGKIIKRELQFFEELADKTEIDLKEII